MVSNAGLGPRLHARRPDQNQGFDSVVVAIGCYDTNKLGVPGEDADGVLDGLEYLRTATLGLPYPGHAGKRVVVIGGGFTSMDCSRTSVRQGAKEVTLVYRRDMKDMPAADEVHEAIEEGVDRHLPGRPDAGRRRREDGKVTGVEFIRMQPGEPDASGRRRPEPAPGTEFTIPCDRVLLAIGQGPELDWVARPATRARGDQAATPQGRRRHVRDRPARRLRHRRRPDRRRDRGRSHRRGAPRGLRRRRVPQGHGPRRDPDPPDAGRAAARVPLDRAVHGRGQGAALPADGPRGRGAQPQLHRVRAPVHAARTAMAESTRCLQCTCEAIGFCDLRRLGIEYGTTLQTLEPQYHQGAGYRCVTENRFTGVNHDYIRDDCARVHPPRAVALHRLRPLRERLRRGRRRRVLRLHAHRLRHARDDAARHEPQRHAVRVVRPLRGDVPDRRAHAQAAHPPEVRGRREPLHPVRDLRRRVPVRRAPRRRRLRARRTPAAPSR